MRPCYGYAVQPHYRDEDNEHVGYLQPTGELYVPLTLIHTPLAEAMHTQRLALVVIMAAGVVLNLLLAAWLL